MTVDEKPLRLMNAEELALPEDSFLLMSGLRPHRLVYKASREAVRLDFDGILEAAIGGSRFAREELTRSPRLLDNDGLALKLEQSFANARQGTPGEEPSVPLSDGERDELFKAFFELQAPGGWASELVGSRFARSRSIRRAVGDHESDAFMPTLARIGTTSDRMDKFANAIRYLGPLRDDPRFAYPLGHTVRNLPVGEKGEFTAAYLEQNRRTVIEYVPPETTGRTRGLLSVAVSDWCRYLGIADKVTVTPQGKLGHQLGLRVAGHQRDPTAIGVGASQLLPVVVLVLGAPDDAVVFLEQPELHLHPKVQSRLGDFFAFARPSIRLVVETHSEYLITRLRLRAAEATLDVDQVAVLFATRHAVGGSSALAAEFYTGFERLDLDVLGDFNAWPADFFDTLGSDTVELAQAITARLKERAPDES